MVESPDNVTVDDVTDDQITVSWNDVATDEDGYRVYVSRDGGLTWSQDSADLAAGTTSYQTSNLLDGEQYDIMVVAFKGTNESGDSTSTRNYGYGVYGNNDYLTYDI